MPMTRLAILTVLAVLPAGGAAQRGDWPMPAKDHAATRYSDLTEITGANAGRLRPVWSFSTGVLGGHEGQPLVVDHTMYVVTPYPNVLYAFDLTREGYPLKWKYRPPVDPTPSASPAATRSIAAPSTRTGRSCTTCWTGTPSQSRPRRARSCGRPGSRISLRARPRRSRLSS